MSEHEIGLREARATLGTLVNRAEYAGETTYITRHGRRVAAIVPINRINRIKETTMTSYTLTVVEGAQPHANGVDLGDPESPVQYADLPQDVQCWLGSQGYTTDQPDVWVLVTPADEDPAAVNVIASRDITL